MSSKRRMFLKQVSGGALGAGLLSYFPHDAMAKDDKPLLPRSVPELQGLSSAQIEIFLDAI